VHTIIKSRDFRLGRRSLCQFSLGAVLFLSSRPGRAQSLQEIQVLHSAAIRVKRPEKVILLAVTRAGDRLVAVGEHGVIIFSDDSGTHWTQASVPVDVTLTCVGFVDANSGWAAGHFGIILKTKDGGETWITQLNGIQANQLTLDAANSMSGPIGKMPAAPLAEKRAELFVDSGPSKPFLCMLAQTVDHVLVLGAYRMAMSTTDGGTTWVDWSLHIGDRFSHNLYATTVIDSDIYIVGESGSVFCSTDNGNSFPMITPPSDVTLFGIMATAAGNIVVFGVAGACFRSTDGGRSWNPVGLATMDNLTAGQVLSSGRVLLVGASGTVFASDDDGKTFVSLPGLPPMTVSDLTDAADGSLIFVGYSGVSKVAKQLFNS
jgi:photosystem II stability/assembly factor-like uncharacterized protein